MQRILIVNGKAQAKALSSNLFSKGYPITLINNDYSICENIASNEKINVIHGDGTSSYILKEAQADNCDIVIALGEHDADNLVTCLLCKEQFHVKKTIALVNDEKKTSFFYKLGVDSVVCAINTINSIIEQSALASELTTSIPFAETRVAITEVRVTETSPIKDKKLMEISLPKQSIIATILRGKDTIIPRGNTTIRTNDMLLLVTSQADQKEAIELITGK